MGVLTQEDREAFADAKLVKLRAALRLTPAQEKQWSSLETTARDLIKARTARRNEVCNARIAAAKKPKQPADIAARLHERAKGLRSSADRAEKFADAAKPLLAVLDEGQKRRFGLLLRGSARRRSRMR